MNRNVRYFALAAGVMVALAAAVFLWISRTNDADYVAAESDTGSMAAQPRVQSAGQLDPGQPTPVPDAGWDVPNQDVGPEEFYFTLASALQNAGFTEEYISALIGLYAGYEPRDFLALEAPVLAKQLTQHLRQEFGYLSASTDDAQDMLEIAHDVYEDLQQ